MELRRFALPARTSWSSTSARTTSRPRRIPPCEEFRAAYLQILATLRGAYGDRTPILCVAPRVEEPAFAHIREICDEAPHPNLAFAAVLPGYCNDGSDPRALGAP